MPTDTLIRNRPAFVNEILNGQNDTKPIDILKIQHPDYSERLRTWEVLLDAYESAGGFLTGSYLWAYPRETREEYGARKAQARYHNYFEGLVDLYVRYMFTQGVNRKSNNQQYNDWTENVDGRGTSIDVLLRQLASVALVHGHSACLVDKTADQPVGPSMADDRGQVIACVFTALAIPDWRFDKQGLQSIKLIEAAPPPSIAAEMSVGEEAVQYAVWDREGWARFDWTGELVGADTPGLGMVPTAILKPKPSYLSQMLGRPLVPNANLIRAMFNRASEEDELYREQSFSLLTVNVPQDGDVNLVKQDLGNEIGANRAVAVKGEIDYKTPDVAVPASIRENIAYLTREIYRAAHVRYQNDSLTKQSGESIRQENNELNEMLQGFSSAMEQCEKDIARAWFAWMTPGNPDAAQSAYEAAQIEAVYPKEFFLDDVQADIDASRDAIAMDLGETMNKRIKKKIVIRMEPDIPADVRDEVFQEIDALEIVSETDRTRAELAALSSPDTGDPEGQGIKNA